MKTYLIHAGIIAALISGGCGSPPEGPNVLLISIDTLRADHLGCYGHPDQISPNIDRIARKGILFENAIAQANWTLPSHVSLFTSLYPKVHLVETDKEVLPGDLKTCAEVFKEHGYDTAAFTDGAFVAKSFGYGQGFDSYDDRSRGDDKDARTLAWIRARGNRAFFLFYHIYDVHAPYVHHPHPERLDRFSPELRERIFRKVERGDYDFTDEEFEAGIVCWHTIREFHDRLPLATVATFRDKLMEFSTQRWPAMPRFNEDIAYIREAYAAGVRHADRRVGRLMEALEERGLDERTLVVVTSDHGECLFEHRVLGHPPLPYDEVIRVPLILRYPPLIHGDSRTNAQVMTIDIMPTLLAIAGLSHLPVMQGESLLPLIKGGSPDARTAFSDTLFRQAARTNKTKYIECVVPAHAANRPMKELYDLQADPSEQHNAIDSAPPNTAFMARELAEWRTSNRRLNRALKIEKTKRARLDKKTREELRALGYMH